MPRPTFKRFDASVDPGSTDYKPFLADKTYFNLTLHEVFLKDGRQWWSVLEPSVYFSVDFIYDRERKTVPYVVGAETFKGKAGEKLPHGFLVSNINIVGPHPFRGDRIGITTVLYGIKIDDYARNTLRFAESVSSAIGVPADIGLIGKVGHTILDALETLANMNGSAPVVGNRIELSQVQGLRPSYFALLVDSIVNAGDLKVCDGKLLCKDGQPYRASDYVLYSILSSQRREEIRTLHFYDLISTMDAASFMNKDEGLERAKATLITIYQEMLSSPDLIEDQVEDIFSQLAQRLTKSKDVIERVRLLGDKSEVVSDVRYSLSYNDRSNNALKLIENLSY